MDIISPIVMGILLGGLYALIAMGLSMVFGVMRLINLAHGDLVILGSYFSFALLVNFGVDPIVSLVITAPVLFGLGFLIQQFLLRRAAAFLLRRAAAISDEAPLIIAFGLALILQNAVQIITDPQSRGISTAYSMASFSVGALQFPVIYLMDFIVALMVMIAFSIFLKKTYLGRAIAAASQNKKAAQLMGINIKNIHGVAFATAMISAAIAGAFLGMTFPFQPTSGTQFLIIAFGVVIIGGLGSLFGTFLGGVILGLVQTLSGYFFGSAAQMLFVYTAIFLVLAVRPKGLFGR
jgi:branched-chain amino acid transport system permease protein